MKHCEPYKAQPSTENFLSSTIYFIFVKKLIFSDFEVYDVEARDQHRNIRKHNNRVIHEVSINYPTNSTDHCIEHTYHADIFSRFCFICFDSLWEK